jgi:hypothetical protein
LLLLALALIAIPVRLYVAMVTALLAQAAALYRMEITLR